MGFAVTPIFADLGVEISGDSLDALDSAALRAAIARGGVVRLRGFAVDQADFVAVSDRVSSRAIAHSLGAVRRRLSSDGTVVTVLPGNRFVDLHGEMYFLPRHPDLVWFWCQRAPTRGGATTVADGQAFHRALSQATRDELASRPIGFTVPLSVDGLRSLGDSMDLERAIANIRLLPGVVDVEQRADDHVLHYTARAIVGDALINSIMNVRRQSGTTGLQVRFADGGDFAPPMLDELAETGEALSRDLDWREGDIVVIDNSRFVHGRRAFEGERSIQVRHTMV